MPTAAASAAAKLAPSLAGAAAPAGAMAARPAMAAPPAMDAAPGAGPPPHPGAGPSSRLCRIRRRRQLQRQGPPEDVEAPPAPAPRASVADRAAAAAASFLSGRRAAVGAAAARRGGRLGAAQAGCAAAFVALTCLCADAYSEVEGDCPTTPVALRDWFRGAMMLHCLCGMCCFAAAYGIVFTRLRQPAAAVEESAPPSAQPAPGAEAPSSYDLQLLLAASLALGVVAPLLWVWTAVGFAALLDAGRPEVAESCREAAESFRYIGALTLIGGLCCGCGTTASVHLAPKSVGVA